MALIRLTPDIATEVVPYSNGSLVAAVPAVLVAAPRCVSLCRRLSLNCLRRAEIDHAGRELSVHVCVPRYSQDRRGGPI